MATRENKAKNPPSSYLKSTLRSQNRPISSTTTATHSTITPLPSDALRNRSNLARHAYAYQFHSTDTHTSLQAHDQYGDTCDYDSDDNRFPRSETPSLTRPKLVWHSLFGISLTRKSSSSISTPSQSITGRKGSTSTSASDPKVISPRKRSFRFTSRPSTPKSIDSSSSKSPYPIPVPSSPLPLSASPRRRSFGLGSSQRSTPNAPNPVAHMAEDTLWAQNDHPTDSAVALPEEPPHRSVHKSGPDGGARNKGKERENLFADPDRPLPPSFDFPSQSLPPDHSRNHLSPDLARLPVSYRLPTVDSASSEENDQSSYRLQIPRIIHTPPTPQRPGEVDSPSRPSNTLPKIDSGKIQVAKGKPVAMAHREQVLVSSSQSHADVQHTPSPKGRFTARFHVPKTKDGIGQKSSKRSPAGSSDGPTHKPSIIGPPRNMTSHRGKLGSFDFERPISALNRSSSTMERQKTLAQADNSSYSKGRLHALERTLSEDSAQAESSATQLKPDHTGDTSVISFSSVSLQTKSTGKDLGNNTPPGQSSSWGRASGRRVLRASHGTFAFEPPSSLPNSPNPHTFNLPSEPHQNGISEPTSGLAQSQPSTPLHAKHSRGQSYNTPDYAEPGYHPGERKPKGKGRSLDLGLGLSWAPSRLREEVLMPGSILAREKVKLEKNRANGTNVTKMFESLLSESRFQTFKKYVRSFDAHIIPLEGPSGLLASVEKLVAESGLSERERKKLMSEFTVFVDNHGG
ncbi:hypothetical protein JVT61DRAFT_12919 [Boletus reticuloceps]|uniref:Uncharacterized protein n=1 Tax=Boletus reticuloceps TaxID=495285 RepID=A0A8I2YT07_9AGAM|nr:hypothetical protein JVT61DRAFT_12919 [Boletus reticuloceps]